MREMGTQKKRGWKEDLEHEDAKKGEDSTERNGMRNFRQIFIINFVILYVMKHVNKQMSVKEILLFHML